jgi:hypothetical protein
MERPTYMSQYYSISPYILMIWHGIEHKTILSFTLPYLLVWIGIYLFSPSHDFTWLLYVSPCLYNLITSLSHSLWSWRWRQHVLRNYWYPHKSLHCVNPEDHNLNLPTHENLAFQPSMYIFPQISDSSSQPCVVALSRWHMPQGNRREYNNKQKAGSLKCHHPHQLWDFCDPSTVTMV